MLLYNFAKSLGGTENTWANGPDGEFSVKCELKKGENQYFIFQVFFVWSSKKLDRRYVTLCTLHSVITYLIKILPTLWVYKLTS